MADTQARLRGSEASPCCRVVQPMEAPGSAGMGSKTESAIGIALVIVFAGGPFRHARQMVVVTCYCGRFRKNA